MGISQRFLTTGAAVAFGFATPLLVAAPTSLPAELLRGETGFLTRVLSLYVTLTTSAAVATRHVVVSFRDTDGRTVLNLPASATVGASATQRVVGLSAATPAAYSAGVYAVIPLPVFWLDFSYRVLIDVENVQAGDALSAISLVVEKLDATPFGYSAGITRGTRGAAEE